MHVDGEDNVDWARGAVVKAAGDWDGTSGSGNTDNGLDLADFSAATFKFRTEMEGMAKGENVNLYDSNDVMEGLFREQRLLGDALEPGEIDESIPEWADVNVQPSGPGVLEDVNALQNEPQVPESHTNAGGRAILNVLQPSNPSSQVVQESSDIKSDSLSNVNIVVQSEVITETVFTDVGVSSVLQNSSASTGSGSQLEVPLLDEAMWMYLDPRNRPQGPFSTSSMRQWMVDGYFSPSLPIKLAHWTDFHPLYSVYVDAVSAFLVVPLEPVANNTQNTRSAQPINEEKQRSNVQDSGLETSKQSQGDHISVANDTATGLLPEKVQTATVTTKSEVQESQKESSARKKEKNAKNQSSAAPSVAHQNKDTSNSSKKEAKVL